MRPVRLLFADCPTILVMLAQRTLKSMTRAVGVGVHSGQKVELTLRPAPPDTGIVFRRIDLPGPVDIPVSPETVSDTRMATTISAGGDPGAVFVMLVITISTSGLAGSRSGVRWTSSMPAMPPIGVWQTAHVESSERAPPR